MNWAGRHSRLPAAATPMIGMDSIGVCRFPTSLLLLLLLLLPLLENALPIHDGYGQAISAPAAPAPAPASTPAAAAAAPAPTTTSASASTGCCRGRRGRRFSPSAHRVLPQRAPDHLELLVDERPHDLVSGA